MMRKFLSPTMVVMLAVGLCLTGCATQQYVDDKVKASQDLTNTKIGEVQTSVEANQKEIGSLHETDAALEAQIAKLSETAKEALTRAEEAGKLARGKFLFEATLTDEDVKFGFNKFELSDEAKAALDAFAAKVKGENKGVYIEIQGHTDDVGSMKYNLELGYKRAEKVLRYLNMEHGFALHSMNVISYGEDRPLDDGKTKQARAQNRRVTLVVME